MKFIQVLKNLRFRENHCGKILCKMQLGTRKGKKSHNWKQSGTGTFQFRNLLCRNILPFLSFTFTRFFFFPSLQTKFESHFQYLSNSIRRLASRVCKNFFFFLLVMEFKEIALPYRLPWVEKNASNLKFLRKIAANYTKKYKSAGNLILIFLRCVFILIKVRLVLKISLLYFFVLKTA